MLIGVVSDTHDHLDRIKAAARLFRERSVAAVIHCGDLCSPFALTPLLAGDWTFAGVFGNNDGERVGIDRVTGGRVVPGPHRLELGGRRIVVMHEPYTLEEMAGSGGCDLVLYGHTHTPDLRQAGRTLIVNPGEACGWLLESPTVALVDLDCLTAEILRV